MGVDGISGIVGNAALVIFSSRHVDVSSLTPRCSPAVLNNVVILATIRAITHSENSMVQSSAAAQSRVKYSTAVELEVSGINSHSLGSVIQSSNEVVLIPIIPMVVTVEVGSTITSRDFSNKTIAIHSACSITGFIRIGRIGVAATLTVDVFPSCVIPSTIASTILGVTVNQLLFAEGNQFSVSFKMSSFERSDCSKCPARTTLTLVLNSSDIALDKIDWNLDTFGNCSKN